MLTDTTWRKIPITSPCQTMKYCGKTRMTIRIATHQVLLCVQARSKIATNNTPQATKNTIQGCWRGYSIASSLAGKIGENLLENRNDWIFSRLINVSNSAMGCLILSSESDNNHLI